MIVRTALELIAERGLRELLPDVSRRLEVEVDPAVKAKCAWVLGHLGCKDAYTSLRACLENTQLPEDVRTWAAWAIGEVGTTRDARYLGILLGKIRSPRLRRAIGGALRKVNLESVRAPARQVARLLHPPESGKPRVDAIVARLRDLEDRTPAIYPRSWNCASS